MNFCFLNFVYLFLFRKLHRRKRKLSCVALFLKCPQRAGFDDVEAESQKLHSCPPGGEQTPGLEPLLPALQGVHE